MRLALATALLSYSLASFFLERTVGAEWADWNHGLGLVLLGIYLTIFYKNLREVILTGFFQIYYSVGMLLSAMLVSGGMYMFEVAEFGDQNGIFWVMMGFTVTGLEASCLGYLLSGSLHYGGGVKKLPRGAGNFVTLSIITATIIISSYVFISYSGPVLLGVDRVTFWRDIPPPYLSFVPTLVTQSFFFVAFYFLWSRRNGQKSGLPATILVAYILVGLFVLGQKLSLFILFITVWFVLLPGVFPNFVIKRSHIVLSLVTVTFLVITVLVSYALQAKEQGFALARIALQAQVLWSVFNDPNSHNLLLGEWSCYFGCDQFIDGKDFISYKYLPLELYNFYSKGGTTLSGFMPALSIATIGIAASLLVHIAISFGLGLVQGKLVVAVSKKNIVYSFLLYKMHIGLSLLWFAALQTAIPGLITILLLTGLYRICFPVLTVKNAAST
jgi:hypothetical protein